jgi:hypothetical protein
MFSIAFSSLVGQDAVCEPGATSPWHQQTGDHPPSKKSRVGGTGATACQSFILLHGPKNPSKSPLTGCFGALLRCLEPYRGDCALPRRGHAPKCVLSALYRFQTAVEHGHGTSRAPHKTRCRNGARASSPGRHRLRHADNGDGAAAMEPGRVRRGDLRHQRQPALRLQPAMEPRLIRLGDFQTRPRCSPSSRPQWSPGEFAWETSTGPAQA